MSNYYSNSSSCQTSSVTVGNSIDINLNTPGICQSAEVRADVVVDEFSAKRVWGRVVNCQGQPIANALAKLVKVTCTNGKEEYTGIAHTITNCEGFYQFDVCADDMSCYKILINKATTGSEVVLDTTTSGGNCGVCKGGNNSYNPCQPAQPPVVVPNQPCGCGSQPTPPCPPMPCPQPMPMPCPQPMPMPCPQPQSCGCQGYTVNPGYTMCK